jgi:hypothetical protein
MKLDDIGSFFIKRKDGIWTVLYVKTNYLLKKIPDLKITYFDMKTNSFKQKKHSPGKAWATFFDKKGLDHVMQSDVSYTEMEKMIKDKSEEIYDFKDYKTYMELYEKMKEDGLKPFYTKKWFEENYNFIKGQIELFNNPKAA